ncbi:hypothetical protein BRC94_06450 [Halobacteriales archaeon QS_5_70_17]|nr:MAG: hypothetical protein BRC94_06450 [Halobacteriales archaeon QS_5_70_17]
MEPAEVERLIEEGVEDADATVSRPRNPDDDSHLAAVVVGTDIHALELKTYTPEEYADHG